MRLLLCRAVCSDDEMGNKVLIVFVPNEVCKAINRYLK